jgi:hypothetical protein
MGKINEAERKRDWDIPADRQTDRQTDALEERSLNEVYSSKDFHESGSKNGEEQDTENNSLTIYGNFLWNVWHWSKGEHQGKATNVSPSYIKSR